MTDIVLTLTPNNPNNTEITLSDSPGVVYKVTTERNGVAATTRVYDKDSREVASLDWRASSPDGVTFGEQDLSAVSVTQWMKKSLVPFKRCVSRVSEARICLMLAIPTQIFLVLRQPREKVPLERRGSRRVSQRNI